MAFPTVPTAAGNTLLSASTSTASTTHTFPSLTTLAPAAGDLIFAICVQYQGGNANTEFSSWGASLTELLDDSNATALDLAVGVAYKIASGSESGTFTVTSAHSFKSVQFLMRIPAATWHGTTAPEALAAVRATGAVPDPGALTPSWGADDTLWISVDGQSETSTTGSPPTLDTPPTNYSGQLIVARNADAVGNITAGVAFRQLNASSEDVGVWTATNAVRGNGLATVIAVRPAAPPPPTSTSVAEVGLDNGTGTPATQTSHSIKVRARTTSGAGTLKAALYEGTTNRSGDLESSALTTSLADYTLAISDANAANITDYTNLSIRLWGYAAGGGSIAFEVDQVWLEAPAAAGATAWTLTPSDTTTATDSFSRVVGYHSVPADTTTSTDVLAKRPGKVLADSTTSTDSLANRAGKVLADSTTSTDSFSRVAAFHISKADSTTSTDSFSRVVAFHISAADTTTSTDSLARTVAYLRTFADTITSTDICTPSLGSGSTAWTLTPSDSTTSSDALVKQVGKVLSDTTTATDAQAKLVGKQIADSTTSTDAFARIVAFRPALSDTTTSTDVFARTVAYHTAFADTNSSSDLLVIGVPPPPGVPQTPTNFGAFIDSRQRRTERRELFTRGRRD